MFKAKSIDPTALVLGGTDAGVHHKPDVDDIAQAAVDAGRAYYETPQTTGEQGQAQTLHDLAQTFSYTADAQARAAAQTAAGDAPKDAFAIVPTTETPNGFFRGLADLLASLRARMEGGASSEAAPDPLPDAEDASAEPGQTAAEVRAQVFRFADRAAEMDHTPLDLDLTLTEGADTVAGGAGNDTIAGMGGDDVISGRAGQDVLSGGAGRDALDGGAGADTVSGGAGNDTLLAGADDDLIFGGTGSDTVFGEAGDDEMWGDEEDDKLLGGDGYDAIFGGAGSDFVSGGTGDDTIDGGTGHDRLQGGDGDDLIFGGVGNDVLKGRAGNDTLMGGDGNDFLWLEGTGTDVTGGAGQDRFQLGGKEGVEGHHVIRDFDTAVDRLDLSRVADDQVVQFLFGGGDGNDLEVKVGEDASILIEDQDADDAYWQNLFAG